MSKSFLDFFKIFKNREKYSKLTAMYGWHPASRVLAMESTSWPLMPKSQSLILPSRCSRIFDGFTSTKSKRQTSRRRQIRVSRREQPSATPNECPHQNFINSRTSQRTKSICACIWLGEMTLYRYTSTVWSTDHHTVFVQLCRTISMHQVLIIHIFTGFFLCMILIFWYELKVTILIPADIPRSSKQ